MANFTSAYLGLLRKKGMIDRVTDENGIEISTIKISEPLEFEYRKPRIIIDRFEKRSQLLQPDIKYIKEDINIVKGLGFEVISEAVDKKWFKLQHKKYRLCYKNEVPTNALIISRDLPQNHRVEFDRANKRARLVGKNAGVEGFGEWLKVY